MDNKPDERPLEELGLSVRSYHCLRRAGVTTVAQLISLSMADIERIPGVGGIYLPGFLKELAANGLTIRS